MMKILLINLFLALELLGCTVYRSPQRKDFESEYSGFQAQNLKQVACSDQTQISPQSSKRLVTVLEQKSPNTKTTNSVYIWEYIQNDQSLYESDNLKGEFCAYSLEN